MKEKKQTLLEENIRNRTHVRYYTHERNDKGCCNKERKETNFNGGDSEST